MQMKVADNVADLLAEAEQLAQARQWSEAADICVQAHNLAQANTQVLDKLGWYLSRAKRYGEAAAVYKQLTELEPRWARWHYMLGYQYYDQKRWADAIRCFEQALQLHPEYFAALYRKGYAHTQVEEWSEARQTLEACITQWHKLPPAQQEREAKYYSDAAFQLGKLMLTNGQTRNAEYYLEQSVRFDSGDAHKFYNYGKALLKNGQPEKALSQLQRAEQLERGKDYILTYIARAHRELGHDQQAEAVINRIPPTRRKGYVWHEIGEIKLGQNKFKEAEDAFRKALRDSPDNHNYHYAIGLCYEGLGDLATARTAYIRAIELRKHAFNLDFPEAETRLAELPESELSGDSTSDSTHEPSFAPDGWIKTYNRERGFGFIRRQGEADVFFHVSEVDEPNDIAIGASVCFEVQETPKGLQAVHVCILLLSN